PGAANPPASPPGVVAPDKPAKAPTPVSATEEGKKEDEKKGDDKKEADSKTDDKKEAETRFNLKDGLVGQTSDGQFRYHVGGRLDWDNGWYRVPTLFQQSLGDTPLSDGTDLRRFRIEADGTVWEQVDFKMGVDLSRASDFTGFKSEPQTNIFITD